MKNISIYDNNTKKYVIFLIESLKVNINVLNGRKCRHQYYKEKRIKILIKKYKIIKILIHINK